MLQEGQQTTIKVAPGGWKKGAILKPLTITKKGNRLELKFPYSKGLIAEVKMMAGARWHGYDEPNPRKVWSVDDCERNWWTLDVLSGKNPYKPYDQPILEIDYIRSLYAHQKVLAGHFITRKRCIGAADMGLGKSLAAIEAAEYAHRELGYKNSEATYWYVGPRAGVRAFERELRKWESPLHFKLMTFNALVNVMKYWTSGDPAPQFVIFDESSKLKTHTSQRSRAALHLSNSMRQEYGDECFVILLSGTPAPKSPADWWHQCEVACPGFLKEGTFAKFKSSLCIIEERESLTGGVYPHLVTWLDDEAKCSKCGEYKDHENHDLRNLDPCFGDTSKKHQYTPIGRNEVARLYKRMSGLVEVMDTKSCVDLPDLIDEVIDIKPPVEMIRALKLIKQNYSRGAEVLIRARELSDGFQYYKTEGPKIRCHACNGLGKYFHPVLNDDGETYTDQLISCENCGGSGEVPEMLRTVKLIETPKDQVVIDELDSLSDIGRLVLWGGFTATVDKLVNLVTNQGWDVLRVDGRGYHYFGDKSYDVDKLMDAMDASCKHRSKLEDEIPRLCVVGQPSAGGVALTFNMAPVALYYSMTFDGEAWMQSRKRHHRLGMDNRPALVKRIHLLPTDELVYTNLENKVRLQDISMGKIEEAIDRYEKEMV